MREVADPGDVLLWGGAPSADGRYLPFTDGEAGNLALLDLATGDERVLTSKTSWGESPEFAFSARISPDGRNAAYSWSAQGDFVDLRVVGIDGSGARIVRREEDVEDLAVFGFLPDGRNVLVGLSESGSRSELALVPLDGGPRRTIRAFADTSPFHVRLSPDGRSAVYDLPARGGAGDRDLFLLSIEDGRESSLVEHPSQDLWPLWSPDGESVLFVSDRTGRQSLWRVGVADGASEIVFKEMGRGRPLGVTDSGAYYYLLQTGSSDVSIVSLAPSREGIASGPALASPWFIGSNLSPDWSPDGRKLAYVSHRGPMTWGAGSRALVIRDAETGDEREILPEMNFFIHPRWSPDGESILVKGGTRDRKWGVHRIRVADGALETVFFRGSFGDFDWSHDGAGVYYERDSDIVKRALDSGEEEAIYRAVAPWSLGGLSLSPDGRWIAFVTATSTRDTWTQVLHLIASTGGAVREFLRVEKPDALKLGDWTDGDDLLFIRYQEPEESDRELWRVPVALGEPEPMGFRAKGLRDVRVHPEGERIAFTSGWPDYSLWVMENFLNDGS